MKISDAQYKLLRKYRPDTLTGSEFANGAANDLACIISEIAHAIRSTGDLQHAYQIDRLAPVGFFHCSWEHYHRRFKHLSMNTRPPTVSEFIQDDEGRLQFRNPENGHVFRAVVFRAKSTELFSPVSATYGVAVFEAGVVNCARKTQMTRDELKAWLGAILIELPPLTRDEVASKVRSANAPFTPNEVTVATENLFSAITTGTFNESFLPENKSSRELFEQLTGFKLPASARATIRFFNGRPFRHADGTSTAVAAA